MNLNPDDDDALWLEALAGRSTDQTATAREAIALRGALRDVVAPRAAADIRAALPDLSRETALIERATREGVIGRIAPAIPPSQPASRRWLPLAASVVLVIGAVTWMQMTRQPSQDVIRGDANGVVHLTAADPRAFKQRLLAELRAAGAEATGYEALGVQGIDADLPVPLTDDLKRVLTQNHIPEPADGALRIEIRTP